MITQINKIDCDWANVKNKCRTTVNKEYTGNEPSSDFKRKILISEHSPIRLLNIDWSWKNIKSWVSVHLSRHKWECFVSTQRTDRTGIDRNELPQDSLVDMDGVANAQNLIDTARKRLCTCASLETRRAVHELKYNIAEYEPELADVLVPNCIYRLGCPEFKPCGLLKSFVSDNPNTDMTNIEGRYRAYKEWCKVKTK